VDPGPTDSVLRRLLESGLDLQSDDELGGVLKRVLEAGVELTDARYAALGVLDGSRQKLESFVFHGIDDKTRQQIGESPSGRGVLGALISDPGPLRIPEVAEHPLHFGFPDGHPQMRSFLGVPIKFGGEPWGVLYLTEKRGGEQFDADDEKAVQLLADWTSVAIANARSVATERLRFAMEAAEHERVQWARELHDESLQGLAAIRLLLATGSIDGPVRLDQAVEKSIGLIDNEIASMRALISDLRPGSLDELGIASALKGLAQRMASRTSGIAIEVEVPAEVDREQLTKPVEVALYRVAQEAITNATRYGGAAAINIELRISKELATVDIRDNGAGFDPSSNLPGYGIMGMRERAELTGGKLAIDSSPGEGTRVRLSIPLGNRDSR